MRSAPLVSAAVTAAFCSAAAAMHIPRFRGASSLDKDQPPFPVVTTLKKRHDWGKEAEPDVMEDRGSFCKWDLGNAESADEAWRHTGAFAALDDFISDIQDGNQDRWLREFEDFIGISGASGASGCIELDGNCKPGPKNWDCDKYFDSAAETPTNETTLDEGEVDPRYTKSAYWIYEAVVRMHSKLRQLHGLLIKETLYSNLKIDEMIDELAGGDGDDDDAGKDIMSWLIGAITMGSTIASAGGSQVATGIIGPASSVLSGVFNLASGVSDKTDGADVDAGDIRSALGDALDAASGSLNSTLKLALGYADDADADNADELGFDKLPHLKDSEDLQTDIGKFFGTGWFLLDDDSDEYQRMLNQFTEGIQAKVADNILQAAGYMLLGDQVTLDDEGDCEDEEGARWLEADGNHYCFLLAKPRTSGSSDLQKAEPELYEKLGDYGLDDLDKYYESIIDCGRGKDNADDHQVARDDLHFGEIPKCLFNMRLAVRQKYGIVPNPKVNCKLETRDLDVGLEARDPSLTGGLGGGLGASECTYRLRDIGEVE